MLHFATISSYILYYTANVVFLLDYLDNVLILTFDTAIGSRIIVRQKIIGEILYEIKKDRRYARR